MATFIRVIGSSNTAEELRAAAASAVPRTNVYQRDVRAFSSVPRSTFAYWAPLAMLRAFEDMQPVESSQRHAAAGASTKDNHRFVRAWWEIGSGRAATVEESDSPLGAWVPLAKGGAHGKYYADVYLRLLWANGGRELKAFTGAWREAKGWGNHWRAELHNADYYGRPGVTWPSRSQVGFGVRPMPGGGVFGDKGPTVFIEDDASERLSEALALMNSSVFGYFVSLLMAFGSFEAGVIQRTPLPTPKPDESARLARLAQSGWSLRRGLDTVVEVSHAFVVPAVLQVAGGSLAGRVSAWSGRVGEVEAELGGVQGEIDELCFELYGISDEDRAAITEGFGVVEDDDDGPSGDEDGDGGSVGVDPVGLAAGLVSWAVGVGVGRFDVRLATQEREWPVEPDPFDPLPVCSPGMLTGDDGLPLVEPPGGYRVSVSSVLVDDPGHELDVTARVRDVFDVVFGSDADGWWSDVGDVLGARGGEVGGWLRKGFFEHHLKTYSKSRRKAPVLWPIATASGSYTVWLYAHRVSSDSLFQVLNDVVAPKVRSEQRRLSELVQEAGGSPSAGERKAIDTQSKFVDELSQLRDNLEAVAPLWAPDLNDGIVIVLAPLWRLFVSNRAWSKELKKQWDALVKGEYDWAQLAMHLWPERVVPKCAEDRSLAIAHGLEDVFWAQDNDNPDKWHPRTSPTTPIDQLIADRHNPATTAALQQATT